MRIARLVVPRGSSMSAQPCSPPLSPDNAPSALNLFARARQGHWVRRGRPAQDEKQKGRVKSAIAELEFGINQGLTESMDAALRQGASLTDEGFEIMGPGLQMQAGLSALCLAAIRDSMSGAVLRVPCLIARGARLDQIDSRGLGVLDFATFEPLADYLECLGAAGHRSIRSEPLARAGHGDNASFRVPANKWDNGCAALTTRQWRLCLRPDIYNSFIRAGLVGAEFLGALHEARPARFAPRVCLLYPQRLLVDAMKSEDADAVRGLVACGGCDGPGDYLAGWLGDSVAGVNAVGYAAILDSAVGHARWLEVLSENGVDLRAPDYFGRSALHVTRCRKVIRFLLRSGVDPWAEDDNGNIACTNWPPDLRAEVQKRRLDSTLPAARIHRNAKRM